jgi:branched-chain amino acid transport system substrate-binding protein
MKRNLLLFFSIFVFCTIGCDTKKEIKIGLAGPMTGGSSQSGESMKRGVMLAVEQINNSGGINNKQIIVVEKDDSANPEKANSVAKELSGDKEVVAVIGHINSSCTLAGSTIYNDYKVPQVAPTSTSPKITESGPYTFRVCITDKVQGEFLAKYAVEKLGKKKIAVLYDNDDYGRGLKSNFIDNSRKLGAEIIYESGYDRTSEDFSLYLSIIQKRNPDLLFIAGLYEQGAKIMKMLKDSKLNITVLGGDGLYSEKLIEIGGQAVEGTMFTLLFHPMQENEIVKKFSESFKNKYGLFPDARAAFSYDATMLVIDAIKKVGPDREKIKDYLTGVGSSTKSFKGVTGTTLFDENGDCIKPILIGIVESGKILPAKVQL